MIYKYISITIRPTYEEFVKLEKPLIKLIFFMEKGKYIIGKEKGKDNKFNHYQICFKTTKHINTVRSRVDIIFKPYLTKKTLKLNKWKKVKIHNMKVSLIGYCVKENEIYKTNWSNDVLLEEKRKYLLQKGVNIRPTLKSLKFFKDVDFVTDNPICGKKFCICWNPNCIPIPRRSYKKEPVPAGIGAGKDSE